MRDERRIEYNFFSELYRHALCLLNWYSAKEVRSLRNDVEAAVGRTWECARR